MKWFGIVIAALVLLFAAAQLVRPEQPTQAADPGRGIQAKQGTSAALAGILERAGKAARYTQPPAAMGW